jgi:hypothetical protein
VGVANRTRRLPMAEGIERRKGSIKHYLREVEQMIYTRAGEPDFNVFLADDLVIDVRVGVVKPPRIELKEISIDQLASIIDKDRQHAICCRQFDCTF